MAGLGLAALAGGCSNATDSATDPSTDPSTDPATTVDAVDVGTEARPADLGFGDSVAELPPPMGEVVLTIASESKAAERGPVEADLAGLEQLGTITTTVYEPFVERDIEVTGVPFDRVLAAAGVEPDNRIAITALNLYQIEEKASHLSGGGGLLVTRVDGEQIPVADGGPIRLVYTDARSAQALNTNLWIWSIATIEVK